MNLNCILDSKIKPDLTKLTNEQLLEIILNNGTQIDNLNNDRNQLINIVIKLWSENKYYDSIDCPICLDSVTNLDHIVTKCGHYFHASCYTKYIFKSIVNDKSKELKCPKCRDLLINMNESNHSQSQLNTILNSSSNLIINTSVDLLEHQDVFIPQANILESRFEFSNSYFNDMEDVDDIVDNFTFPINLHSGLWTDVNNVTGNLFQNFINDSNTSSNISLNSDSSMDIDSIINSDPNINSDVDSNNV